VPDANISVAEAAGRLGVSKSYLYKNAKALPFVVKIGRRRVCSSSRLERWNRSRLGI
jgi:excisionase family DNA binding protein